MTIVKRKFYKNNTLKVAKELLGCYLVREYKGKIMKAMITETEAYRGFHDAASHASRGKTSRNEIMFGEPGRAYVYLIYGMHSMLNVVTEKKDYPAAVLIRAVRPVETPTTPSVRSTGHLPLITGGEGVLLDGPGKLTKFLHIDRSLNGHDLTIGKKLWIERPKNKKRIKIMESPRIGVDYAGAAKEWKWNFRIVD